MAKRTITLRNAGLNGDTAEDLYDDALEMLRELSKECQYDPEGCSVERVGREIEVALKILERDRQET